jgi:hypothetical protein
MAKKTVPAPKTKAVKKVKPAAPVKPKPKPKPKPKKPDRLSWLSEADVPVIDEYAQQAKTFLKAMADGVIDGKELKEQEAHLVELMKEIEPKLNDKLHEKVTRLLCELTVYDLMKVLHTIQKKRPQTEFQG